MTDTSAYNAMVFMREDVRDEFFQALWGASGLGLTLGRVTLNSADYSLETFSYDAVPDDFEHAHFGRADADVSRLSDEASPVHN